MKINHNKNPRNNSGFGKNYVVLLLAVFITTCLLFTGGAQAMEQNSKRIEQRPQESSSDQQLTTLEGRYGRYTIEYDQSQWDVDTEPGGDMEFAFAYLDAEVYAMIIAERIPLSQEYLRDMVVENFRAAASNVRVLDESSEIRDGIMLMRLTMSGNIDGIGVIYHGVYYTGQAGTIQVVTFAQRDLFEEYRGVMDEFLNGFAVEREIDDEQPSSSSPREQKVRLRSESGTYSIEYDQSRWERDTETVGDEEFFFTHRDGDVFAMIIAERMMLTPEALRSVVVDNFQAVAENFRMLEESTETHGDMEVMCLTMSGIINGAPTIYHGYYYTGPAGTIQVITMTTQNLFEQYRDEMEEFLNGFEVETDVPASRSSRRQPRQDRWETVTGRYGTYSLEYNSALWEPDDMVTGDQEFFFSYLGGEAYGMIVAERMEFSRKSLRDFVIDNIAAATSEYEILEERTVTHRGVQILCLTTSAIVEGIPLVYYGYYYTGEPGTIQVVTFTTPNVFDEFRADMQDFVNGLTVLED
ncbi:MAG: hypothetical protein JW936_06605 [Sedimentisphaerales bacterium]|nr:hypothetical protein [Sedimentisphaerales bacterium]